MIDLHCHILPWVLSGAYKIVSKLVGERKANQMVRTNPMAMLQGNAVGCVLRLCGLLRLQSNGHRMTRAHEYIYACCPLVGCIYASLSDPFYCGRVGHPLELRITISGDQAGVMINGAGGPESDRMGDGITGIDFGPRSFPSGQIPNDHGTMPQF